MRNSEKTIQQLCQGQGRSRAVSTECSTRYLQVILLVELKLVIHVTLQVDSNVGHSKDRPVDVNQTMNNST